MKFYRFMLATLALMFAVSMTACGEDEKDSGEDHEDHDHE